MLSLAKNFRRTVPRCCLGCAYRIAIATATPGEIDETRMNMVCQRDPTIGLEDDPEYTICDGYKSAK